MKQDVRQRILNGTIDWLREVKFDQRVATRIFEKYLGARLTEETDEERLGILDDESWDGLTKIVERIVGEELGQPSFTRPMTLGDMIDALEQNLNDRSKAARVVFDFPFFFPSGDHSYRGYYSDLAFTPMRPEHPLPGARKQPPTGEEFLTELKLIAGDNPGGTGFTYTGYKGGEYTMSRSTPVWVAEQGTAPGVAIVAIDVNDFEITLRTWKID